MRLGTLVLAVATALMCGGCRVVPAGAQPSASSALTESSSPSISPAAPDAEAPPECGFPPGTALEYAGRSTTAMLDVQEVAGDPMSDDPADIYITRDEFDQGELHGRLACAIYAEPAGFVEVTVVPEGWELGGARPPDPPTAEPTPVPERPSTGISQSDAIAIAREVARHPEAEVGYVSNGPAAEALMGLQGIEWADAIPADGWLWQVTFRYDNGEGTTVVIDYVDGTLYGSFDWIE